MSKPSRITELLRASITMKEPFFLKGPVGVGKSQIAKQVCDELGYEFIDVRLATMDPTDIKGFPAPDLAKKTMHWLPANFLPATKTKTKGLLFLDEMNSALPAIQASAYQLTLDRRIGDYELPAGWTVGAAGNRAIDRSIVNQTPAALNNRLIHMEMETDLDDWVNFARIKNISDTTIAFLRFKSMLLHSFDPAKNPEAFPTPRGWFKVDKIESRNFDPAVAYDLIKGTVGEAAAVEHKAFKNVYMTLPTIDEIAVSPDGAKLPTTPGALHAIITSMGSKTTKTSFPKFVQYVGRMPPEWQVLYVRDAMKVCRDVIFTREFRDWSVANQNVTL